MSAILDHYRLRYRGDLTGKIEGQILGPNIFGERFVIAFTTYDPENDRTIAYVRFAEKEDLEAA